MAEPVGDVWAQWLRGRRDGDDPAARRRTLAALAPVRDRILARAAVRAGDVVLDLGTGEGLVAFGALERVGATGRVLFSDVSQALLDRCRAIAERAGCGDRCGFLRAPADDLGALADASVDVVTTRAVLLFVRDKARAFREVHRVLRPGGRVSVVEPINRYFGTARPPHLFPSTYDGYDVTPVVALAERVYPAAPPRPPEADPMLDFDERDLLTLAEGAGFGAERAKVTQSRGRNWWPTCAPSSRPDGARDGRRPPTCGRSSGDDYRDSHKRLPAPRPCPLSPSVSPPARDALRFSSHSSTPSQGQFHTRFSGASRCGGVPI